MSLKKFTEKEKEAILEKVLQEFHGFWKLSNCDELANFLVNGIASGKNLLLCGSKGDISNIPESDSNYGHYLIEGVLGRLKLSLVELVLHRFFIMDFNFKFLVRNRNSLFGHNFVANESSEISSLFKFFLDPRDREIKHLDYYVIGNVLGEINRSFEGIRLGIDLFDIFLFRDMAKLMQSNSKLIITSCLLLEEIEKLFSEEKYRITDLFDEVLELDLKISQESFRLIKSTYEYDSQLWEAR